MPFDRYDEYKFIDQSLTTFTANRTTTNNNYLAFNTSLVGGLFASVTLLAQQGIVKASLLLAALGFGGLVGFIAARAWTRVDRNYLQLIVYRRAMLRDTEAQPDFPEEARKLYHEEYASIYRPGPFRRRGPFSLPFERSMQSLFLLVYAASALSGLAGLTLLILGQLPAWVIHP